jgi:hypothetical protein
VPAEATPGFTFSRWRFSDQPDLDYFTPMEGQAPIGEVEDHLVEILGQGPVDIWEKWINGELWRPEISFTVETSDTIQVVEVVRTDPATAFELTENWEPAELRLLDYAVDPLGFGEVISQTEVLKWEVPADHPEVMVLTKWFHVEPCTWAETVLEESLEGPEVPEPSRPVVFQKKAPILAIDALYESEVFAGDPAQFTLVYSNTGGYENNVVIRNDFPPEATFESSIPAPDRWDEESGLWAEWDLGDLPTGALDTIDVTVDIAPDLPLSTTVQVRDAILNHLREEADSVEIELHVAGTAGEPVFDLGDAPDSTNHAGVQMFTYAISPLPGVPANFPSVFDPATGLPQGPLHLKPLADAWLGPWVTLEYDADLMPDQDGVPNLDPLAGVPDLDGADDGITLPVVLPDCTRTIFTYTVTVTPGAPTTDRFVNVWFDWIRDGDWDDVLTCAANGDAAEWAVQNQVLSALPPGTYVFQTPAFLPYNKVPELPIWMRISIAEQPAPNPPDGSLPDGRGPANGYLYGETEDYYLPGVEPVPAEWAKWIDGHPWTPNIAFTVETSQTIQVVDAITAPVDAPFTLVENWVPAELRLTRYAVEPLGFSQVISEAGNLIWKVDSGHPEVITLTKWFHVEPCTWAETVLEEALQGLEVPELVRPVGFEKAPPELWIDAEYDPRVFAGDRVGFTLVYSNTGGAENDVVIRNGFPDEAPYVSSVPSADRQGPDGSWAEWDVPFLPGGGRESIDVLVDIAAGLPPSTTVVITDAIYNHVGEVQDEVTIAYHVEPPPWKKWIDGVAWQPGITFTVETSQTIEVVDVITTDPQAPFQLTENWDPTKLRLRDYEVTPMDFSQVVTSDGTLVWDALPSHPEVITLTKWFHVEPSTWTETTLREVLEGINVPEPIRTVIFEKLPPELKLDAVYQPEVYAGDVATFTLVYSNTGGAENLVAIRNEFPSEALFLDSNPKPAWQAPDGSEVRWEIGYLGMGDTDEIDVMVAISSSLPVSTQITIVDDIHNHLGEAVDRTTITYHVRGSPPQPDDRDIYIKDSPSDDGSVPSTPPWWISPDMWVRTDGNCANTTHQNPVAGTANTICVRVRNRMTTTVSDITVNLYWGSAALGLYWPGSYSSAGSAHIASLAGGAQAVVAVPWNTPNITGHFCLLARADSSDDPVGSGPDTTIPQNDVQNNNNISMKNVNIVAYPELSCGSFTSTPDTDVVYLDVVNPTGHGATVDVELDSGDFSLGTGEIVVDPGALTWSSLNNLAVVGPDLIATGFPAKIVGIDMDPYETVRISVTITAPLDERFVLHVSEWVDGEPVGGVDYVRMLPHCTFSPIILKNYSAPTTALGGMAAQIAPTWYEPAPGRRLRRTR